MKRINRHKNRGFTLVELIIVVAIIAVLAAVLAPQYIRYVERSRQSNDLQIAVSIARAATVAMADPDVDPDNPNNWVSVRWDTSTNNPGTTSTSAVANTGDGRLLCDDDDLALAIAEVMGISDNRIATSPAYIYAMVDAQSALSEDMDFCLRILPATGEMFFYEQSVADVWGDAETSTHDEYIGINSIGLPPTP